VQRCYRFAACVLLAFWLPAMLHCAIEAGLPITSPTACCSGDSEAAGDEHCITDGCELLEAGFVGSMGEDLLVDAPTVQAALCRPIEITPPVIIVPTVSPERSHGPPEWVRTWQFTARAALAPRAP